MKPLALSLAAALALILSLSGAEAQRHRDTAVPMQPVADLDLDRYLGLWYEIARYPNRFERDCVAVTAEYTRLDDGRIGVRNSCRKISFDGRLDVAEGTARVEGPGRLSVNFVRFLPFVRGDYWVLDVTPDYTVAVVGEPSGRFGWILARSPRISEAAWTRALTALERNGYDTGGLYRVPHP